MQKIEFLTLLKETADAYRKTAKETIELNSHMNNLNGQCDLTQDEIDAVLVDFINYLARNQGVDYGLCTKDLITVHVHNLE